MNSLATPSHTRQTPAALPFCRRPEKRLAEDELYSQVFDAILEQRIAPSGRFTPESLALMFGVPRSWMERTLTRLAHQQVIILKPNHRPEVATTHPQQARQILHARRIAEPTLAQLLCHQRHPDAIHRLRASTGQHQLCIARGQQGAAIRLSGEFHLLLANLAGNGPLAQFLGNLVPLTSLVIAQLDRPVDPQWSAQWHTTITDALEQSDQQTAAQLLVQYLHELELALTNVTT